MANFRYRLLVIDDEPLNQELLASSLSAGVMRSKSHSMKHTQVGGRIARHRRETMNLLIPRNRKILPSPSTFTLVRIGYPRRVKISIFTPFSQTCLSPYLRRIAYASPEMLPLASNHEREISR